MLRYQRGATLLEAILVSAIMGWVLAYVGTQLKSYAINEQLDKTAVSIIHFNSELKAFLNEMYLKLDVVDAVTNKDTIPNPLFTSTTVGKQHIGKDLKWIKSTACSPAGTLSENVSRVFVSCGYEAELYGIQYNGIYLDYEAYHHLTNPLIKRFPTSAWMLYVNEDNKSINDFISIVSRLPNVKRDDGTFISEDKIRIAEFTRPSKTRLVLVEGSGMPLSRLLSPNIDVLDDYIKKVTSGKNYAGVYIPIVNNNEPDEIYLMADGSIPVDLDKSICWDSKTGNKKSCIRSISDDTDRANFLVVEGGFMYGPLDNKRTPVEVSYNTFVNNQDVRKPYLICPYSNTEDVYMLNKIAVFSSSFSSGSEDASTFVDSSQIVSKGTKGANGKHAMISGLSFEWKANEPEQAWDISGAVAIDAAYAAENGNSSVLRNPKSMSFIVIQWCEQRRT